MKIRSFDKPLSLWKAIAPVKNILLVVVLLLLIQQVTHAQVPGQQRVVNMSGLLPLVWLPADYNTTPATKKYPLIIVLQGLGVNDSAGATHEGLTGKIASGWNAQQLLPDGTTAKFIVVSMPDHNYGWPIMDAVLNYCLANFKVDTNHIIGTGLSQGATDLMKYRLNLGTPSVTAYRMRVMILLSTPSQSGTTDIVFQNAGPTVVRYVTGSADPIGTPTNSYTFTSQFNMFNPGNKTYTTIIAGGGHNAGVWDSAYSTKGFDSVHNAFVWAMMVNPFPPVSYLPPLVNAGVDKSTMLPMNSVTLTGGATDPNAGGSILSYLWTQISGPNTATLVTASSSSTMANNLIQGTYQFKLTAADNYLQSASDTVNVVVNVAPVAKAGSDTVIETDNVTLNATSSFSVNGPITQFRWRRLGAPAPGEGLVMDTTYSVTLAYNMLDPGDYQFELKVTDNVGFTGIDTLNVVRATVLPVTFVYLNGKKAKDQNIISWATATEQNSDHFEIERSDNGTSFVSIGKVAAAGNTVVQQNYTFTDNNPLGTISYYRIKQVDKDGRYKRSQIISISNKNNTGITLEYYPNPIRDNVYVNLQSPDKGETSIRLMNAEGRLLTEQRWQKDQETLAASLNLQSLTPGIYFMEIRVGNSLRELRKIVKQ